MHKFFFILLFFPTILFAATDIYSFKEPQQQQRFQTLTAQLRCLVCQNQSLTESNAPLAQDLRRLIAEKINLGLDDQHIRHFLVERYGDFILYQPPLNKMTYFLWFGPFLLLLFGLVILAYCIKRRNLQQLHSAALDQQQQHLIKLLMK